jgi:hypothetical protein
MSLRRSVNWPVIRATTARARAGGTPSKASDSQSVSIRQTRPPGRVTRASSPITASASATCCRTRSHHTPSTESSGRSSADTSPVR